MMIDGATCTVTAVTNTELECETGPHYGSVRAKVEVEVAGNGIAEEVDVTTSMIYRDLFGLLKLKNFIRIFFILL